MTIELLVLIDFSNFESKYSISFDFYFSLLSLSLSILFSFFDELREFDESKNDFETFVRRVATMIWVNSNRWASKKSKLNELKLNELKIISSREISFVIVEFLTKFDKSLTKKSLIDELLIKFNEFSIKVKSFDIETKWETIVWNVLTNFLKRVLFIVYSSNQIRVSSKSTNKNELRVRRSIDSIIKTRKCWRQIFSTINFVNRSTKLSYRCSIFTKFLSWWANMTISQLICWLLNDVNVFVKNFMKNENQRNE